MVLAAWSCCPSRYRAWRRLLAMLPAILVLVVLQRFIVGAFVAGALKG